jgi:hypothetical protein
MKSNSLEMKTSQINKGENKKIIKVDIFLNPHFEEKNLE